MFIIFIHLFFIINYYFQRLFFEIKFPTIWANEQSRAEAKTREKLEEGKVDKKRSEERRCRYAKK